MALETCSNITGNTVNPHNTALSAGGSSGGESALQALYGSPLGIGSDIGTSQSVFHEYQPRILETKLLRRWQHPIPCF